MTTFDWIDRGARRMKEHIMTTEDLAAERAAIIVPPAWSPDQLVLAEVHRGLTLYGPAGGIAADELHYDLSVVWEAPGRETTVVWRSHGDRVLVWEHSISPVSAREVPDALAVELTRMAREALADLAVAEAQR